MGEGNFFLFLDLPLPPAYDGPHHLIHHFVVPLRSRLPGSRLPARSLLLRFAQRLPPATRNSVGASQGGALRGLRRRPAPRERGRQGRFAFIDRFVTKKCIHLEYTSHKKEHSQEMHLTKNDKSHIMQKEKSDVPMHTVFCKRSA